MAAPVAAPAASAIALLLSSFLLPALAANLCIPSEPHVDCGFYEATVHHWKDFSAAKDELNAAWKDVIRRTEAYPLERFAGRGLVVTATSVDFANLPVLLEVLESQDFSLPIEIWYPGKLATVHQELLSDIYSHTLTFKDVFEYASPTDLVPRASRSSSQGKSAFQVKALAILHSAFEEILFLDADNVPLYNPTSLFSAPEYERTGALFWPDFWTTPTASPIWPILDLIPSAGFEQESGQLVVNKTQVWGALNLAFYFAKNATFQHLIHGDKEAFRLAFLATGTPFFMVGTPVATAGVLHGGKFCGHTMVQHDTAGVPLFLHHNSLKAAVPERDVWQVSKSVAAFDSSFTMEPLPAIEAFGVTVNCLDMVGNDVITTFSPFSFFEDTISRATRNVHPEIRAVSSKAAARLRKLAEGCPNTCYNKNGKESICCDPAMGLDCPLKPDKTAVCVPVSSSKNCTKNGNEDFKDGSKNNKNKKCED